jgi:MFS family permease
VTADIARSAETAVWGPDRRLLTAGLVFMVTAVAFEGLAVPTILPATLAELPGLELYGWAFSGFWLSNLVGIALAGAEADRRGPFSVFVAGVVAFTGGLVIAGLAPAMEWVVIGRVVQGLGAGAIAAITYVAIARGYATAAQPRMIAVLSSAWVVPGLLGPAVAGWVSQELTWRWAFLGLAPLLPVAAAAVGPPLWRMGAPVAAPGGTGGASSRAAPVRDALLLAVGAGLVLSAASLGTPLLGFAAAAIGLTLLVPALRRLLPDGTLLARPGRGAAVATLGLMSVAFFGAEAFVPLAVASVRNAGTVAGGLALTTAAVTWASGAWVQARLAARSSRRSVTTAGLALVGAGIVLVAAVPVTSLPAIVVAGIAWALAGFGMGLSYSTATLAVIESAAPGAEGAASASVQLAEALGIAIGTGVAGAAVALSANGPLGIAPGILIADLLMLGALLLAMATARRMLDRPAGQPVADARAMGTERGPSL